MSAIAIVLYPIVLHRHPWHTDANFQTLYLILDVSYIDSDEAREARIHGERAICNVLPLLRNVKKVVVQNICFREETPAATDCDGQRWTILEWEDDSDDLIDDRWQLEFSAFEGGLRNDSLVESEGAS